MYFHDQPLQQDHAAFLYAHNGTQQLDVCGRGILAVPIAVLLYVFMKDFEHSQGCHRQMMHLLCLCALYCFWTLGGVLQTWLFGGSQLIGRYKLNKKVLSAHKCLYKRGEGNTCCVMHVQNAVRILKNIGPTHPKLSHIRAKVAKHNKLKTSWAAESKLSITLCCWQHQSIMCVKSPPTGMCTAIAHH